MTASFTDSVVWSLATSLLFLAELIFSRDEDGWSEVHQMAADCQAAGEKWPRVSAAKL